MRFGWTKEKKKGPQIDLLFVSEAVTPTCFVAAHHCHSTSYSFDSNALWGELVDCMPTPHIHTRIAKDIDA